MSLIIKNFIDKTEATRPECFIKINVFRSKEQFFGIKIDLFFYHSIDSFLQKKPFFDHIAILIPIDTQVYERFFKTEISLEQDKSDLVLGYEFLKQMDGTEQTICFKKTITESYIRTIETPLMTDENGDLIIDDSVPRSVSEPAEREVEIVELKLSELLDIPFCNSISTFSVSEIQNGKIDGLAIGKNVFCEETKTIWSINEIGVYSNSGLTIGNFSL